MTNSDQNISLFITSLLSSTEISIDQNAHKESKTLIITNCTSFNNSRNIIPLDLIATTPLMGKSINKEWLLFGVLSLFASALFLIMADSQHMTFPLYLAAGFILSTVYSIYAANKYANTTYSYCSNETKNVLFKLTSNDVNQKSFHSFMTYLSEAIKDSHTVLRHLDNKPQEQDNSVYAFSTQRKTATEQEAPNLATSRHHLSYLYEQGIINESLLKELQKRAFNKAHGITDSRPLAQVIPLPVSG